MSPRAGNTKFVQPSARGRSDGIAAFSDEIVALALAQECLDFRRGRRDASRPAQPEAGCQRFHGAAPVREQIVVKNDRSRQAPGGELGFAKMLEPSQMRARRFQSIACLQGIRDRCRMPHDEQHAQVDTGSGERLDPERQKPAKPRILHRPQFRAGKFLRDQRSNSPPGGIRRCRSHPPFRERAGVVPTHAQALQQRFVNRDHLPVLPVAQPVAGAGVQQAAAKLHPKQIEHPCGRRGAAAVHAHHKDRFAGGIRVHQASAAISTSGRTSKSTSSVASRRPSGMIRIITASMIRSRKTSPSGSAAVTPAFRK